MRQGTAQRQHLLLHPEGYQQMMLSCHSLLHMAHGTWHKRTKQHWLQLP
jgi:hypothetical protein